MCISTPPEFDVGVGNAAYIIVPVVVRPPDDPSSVPVGGLLRAPENADAVTTDATDIAHA
jgi:hypothetical protein